VLIVCKVLSRDIGTTLWTTMVINIWQILLTNVRKL
jgi:hypothetical protein